jgi:hypothetical protein
MPLTPKRRAEILEELDRKFRGEAAAIPTAAKVRYVKCEALRALSEERQGQTRDHSCYWPGCDKQVPPAMWGCRAHWMKLPAVLRAKVWAAYRPGQEKTMTPSRKYVKVAREVREWVLKHKETADG